MEHGQGEVDLAPFKAANLDHPLDLGRGEVLAPPQLGVLRPARRNCSVFDGRCDEPQLRFH